MAKKGSVLMQEMGISGICPDCEYEVMENKANTKAIGFATTTLCTACENQRQTDAAESAKRKKQQDANVMIADRANKIAQDELVAEGKIKIVDGVPETV